MALLAIIDTKNIKFKNKVPTPYSFKKYIVTFCTLIIHTYFF